MYAAERHNIEISSFPNSLWQWSPYRSDSEAKPVSRLSARHISDSWALVEEIVNVTDVQN